MRKNSQTTTVCHMAWDGGLKYVLLTSSQQFFIWDPGFCHPGSNFRGKKKKKTFAENVFFGFTSTYKFMSFKVAQNSL